MSIFTNTVTTVVIDKNKTKIKGKIFLKKASLHELIRHAQLIDSKNNPLS